MTLSLTRHLLLPLVAAGLVGCAHNSPHQPIDPLEPMNRGIYAFNIKADRYVLRPVAKGYRQVVPQPVRIGINNFLDNLFYPRVIIHDVLQGKFIQGGKDLGRFAMNTTFGLAGFIDVASLNGLPRNDEDFGQTLGVWGIGEGWYLMIPLLGPATNRDLVGRIGDNWTSPLEYADGLDTWDRLGVTAVDVIDSRANLLGTDALLEQQLDGYAFVRSAYLQSRQAEVRDGAPPEDEFDYGIELPDE